MYMLSSPKEVHESNREESFNTFQIPPMLGEHEKTDPSLRTPLNSTGFQLSVPAWFIVAELTLEKVSKLQLPPRLSPVKLCK